MIVTRAEFFDKRGGEDRVLRRLQGGAEPEKLARVDEVLRRASEEAVSQLAPIVGRPRALALDSASASAVIKDNVASAAWFFLLEALADQLSEDVRRSRDDVLTFYRQARNRQVDLMLVEAAQASDTAALSIHFNRRRSDREFGPDTFEVP